MTTGEFKPMLASPFDKSTINFPALVSQKLDGIRCCIVDGRALTRSLKPIPNKYVRMILSDPKLSGLDGEIIIGEPNAPDVYNVTNSGVMSHDGTPDFCFYVFDDFSNPLLPYTRRIESAYSRIRELRELFEKERAVFRVKYLIHHQVEFMGQFDMMEQNMLEDGYEGIMMRRPDAPYKFGRATPRSGDLIKKKNFEDSEAEIIGVEELMHNDNEVFTNELGRTARSKAQENLRGGGVLGAFVCRDCESGAEFKIGTGFDAAFRAAIWINKEKFIGRICVYKSFKIGVKDAPRHPVWKGFRDKSDMS